MNTLYALRRANGDWFALDDEGKFRVPIFHSSGAAMRARSRDSSMECFRPVELDASAFQNLTNTDEGKACFWLIADPLMKLSRGRALDRQQLAKFMANGEGQAARIGAV
ncbi:MAG TPA: hypothetical protein VMZ30_08830 [Pyrinomonadaceae bacterium]|nr:hypothetical protein [Pyrinomonadaceae bacterium]